MSEMVATAVAFGCSFLLDRSSYVTKAKSVALFLGGIIVGSLIGGLK